MSITDELREWAEAAKVEDIVLTTYPAKHAVRGIYEQLLAIADRIDAEHESAVMSAMNDALYHANDESMAELGWVRLPVDADGVPIRVGDVLDPPADCDDYMPLMVMCLTYDGYENEWFFDGDVGGFCGMVAEHMDTAGWTHHHALTVEDVLREFVAEFNRDDSELCDEEIIERFAAKLRLAGDGE